MRLFSFFWLVFTHVSACAPPDASTTNGAPRQTTPVSCARIVSLAPSITETLFALGLGDRVAGVTRFCTYPAEAARKPSVGGYMDPSMEAIVALSPSLVMLLSEHGPVAEKLAALGIPTLALSNRHAEEIHESIARIGRACGAEANAKRLRARLIAETARVRERVKGLPRVRTLVTMGRNMGAGTIGDVFVAGEDIFYSDLIRAAGGVNAYDGEVPVPMVSLEGIIAMNPEVIVDMVPKTDRRGGVSAAAVAADWQRVPVEAVRNGRVFVWEEPYAVVPGPRYVKTMEDLARMLHPSEVSP